MRVLIIGSGGREHALSWKVARSGKAEKIYCAPGNGGTAQEGENIPLKDSDRAPMGSTTPDSTPPAKARSFPSPSASWTP